MKSILRLAMIVLCLGAGGAQAADDVMIVFDGSNSMWGQIDGTAKIEIARDVMGNLMGDWTADTNLGLMAYGHRRRGDCADIETIVPPGPDNRDAIVEQIGKITPRGKTPLTTAVGRAAEALSYRDNPATVILISDGIESCRRDPCALAGELERDGVAFTAHVIGFGLDNKEDQQSLACIADRTGGRFLAAGDAAQLGEALSEVSTAVAEAPEPEPQPAPEPVQPSITVDAPDTAVHGSKFEVKWSETLARRDYVTILPVDADEDTRGDYIRAGDGTSGTLTAPAETGLYEVRYVDEASGEIAGRDSIEIVEAEVAVTGPETASAGSRIEVQWSGNINPRDYVTIVPADADEGEHTDYARVGDGSAATLTAPSSPGLYELRYVLDKGKRTLASAPIELTEPSVTISGPESTAAGSRFEVSWSRNVNGEDYVTIVPAGADAGSHGDYERVKERSTAMLTAPTDPGLYELRYLLDEGDRTLASVPIEVTEPEMSVSAPETIRVGDPLKVAWDGAVPNGEDYVTIVPAGTADTEHGNYERVKDDHDARLDTPEAPGLYEVRYILDQGKRVLARATVEVVGADATLNTGGTLEAPATASPGKVVHVSWTTDQPGGNRRVTLARPDQASFTWIESKKVDNDASLSFTMPGETGFYEFRLLDLSEKTVLSRATVEVK